MSIVMQYVDRLHEILDKHADQRTTNWFLMSSPFPTLFICLSYVYVVKVIGPKWMENRKPFQLKNALIAYNLFQMLFSAWLFYEIGLSGWLTGDYSLRCQPVDYSDRPQTMRMVHACWWYYFSKFTEFMDTIFFVLRKKNDHVSTLHVIHHGCMPMSVWFGVKFTPGGHSTFFGLLNTFVHIVMYTYYLLAAMGPRVQPYLWWKKYLTVFQMIQFVVVMIHAFQLLFINCNYPKAFVWLIGLHATMFFFLFNEFYQQSYLQRRKPLKKDQQNHHANGVSNGTIGNGISNTSSGRRDAADYYVKGDSLAASELNLRKSYTTTE
ncbi:elongation of very long chain fatty acids protein AAEL008004-like isoform X1 [Osmia bicornis bicornis]|uniref:elongation of very long chain fatty acids protein AAEL008004-like isoform X1 n=1 Tax=Osmia bicornis bicornis TaxID=1437191 RepID=UPI0010F95099|nr:elongation of very long chain fatty acids protein AAEL008004-like isoform X1 [Osmia bicornis bicornis]XP_029048653.1 elongation of very long chain fatty acids protein AAEL008004-like isoform X1 [Osmia bicornis bicornis]